LIPSSHTSAATYQGSNLARDSVVAAFGPGVATKTEGAKGLPLPTEIAGTKVEITDSKGVTRLGQLFFVVEDQVRYLMPADVAAGEATLVITSGNGKLFGAKANITNVTPGLFAANDSGGGIANGYVCRVNSKGAKSCEGVFDHDSQTYKITPRAIDLGVPTDKAYLTLHGTGFRYRSSLQSVTVTINGVSLPVTEITQDSAMPGRDKVTLLLPRTLIGAGLVDVVLKVDGVESNKLQLLFK
jgi:uncharacterized protein (TIGR03437 family)